MSASIDERIVQMQFDNAEFESKAKTTMSTLEKLKDRLKFTKSTTELGDLAASLDEISNASEKAAKNTEQLKSQTTLLGRVVSKVKDDIATNLKNTATSLASALTINPPKDGLEEYKMQMDSIQTIMANVKSKGSTMADVTAALDELNTYADQTIYNFSQMTKNIGTFTAAGVGLKTSVASIKGIANLAAVSGSTSQQASTAMYQLSQAIAAGTVKLQDWNSVVNAGMGGETFQKALERTAKVMGTGVETAMAEVNGSFRESLSKGWLTSDVLTETLAQISGAYDDATLAAKGYTEEQIKEIQELAQTAVDAATKIKTLPQLIDVAKEALGSGWTKSFEYIFGNFEQAEEIFTSIGTTMQKFIDISSDARNSVLKQWSDMGGRQQMVTGLANAFWSLYAVVASIKKAFTDVFPAMTGKTLFDLTKKFREFTAGLMITKQTSENIQSVFRAFFNVIKSGISIIGGLAKAMSPVARVALILVSILMDLLAFVADLVNKFVDWVNENNLVQRGISALVTVIGSLVVVIAKAVGTVISFVSALVKTPIVQTIFTTMAQAAVNMYNKMAPCLQLIAGLIVSLVQKIRNIKLPNMTTVIGKISSALTIVYGVITKVTSAIAKAAKTVSGLASKLTIFNKLQKWLMTIGSKSKTLAITSNIVKGTAGSMNELSTAMSSDGINQAPQKVNLIGTAVAFLSSVAADAKTIVVGFFTGLVSKIQKIRQTPNIIKLLTDKIKALKDGLVELVSQSAIGPFFENAKEALSSFKDSIVNFVTTTMDYLKQLDPKALIAFAFGVGLVALVFSLQKLSDAATSLVKDLGKTLSGVNTTISTFNSSMKQITTSIDTMVQSFKKSKITQVGVAVIAFAASLWILSSIPPKQLAASAGAIAGIGLAMAVLSKACSKAESAGAAYTIAALGVGLLAVAYALNSLTNITWDQSTLAKFGALIGAAVVLVAGTIALSKWAPKMIANATSLLIYSASISLLLKALGSIKDFNIEGMEDSISALIVVIGMLMALSVAAKGVKFSSGLGMIGMIASIYVMEKALQKVADSGISWQTIEDNLDKFVIVLGSITVLAFAAAIAGKYAARAGVGALAVAAAIRLIITPLEELGEMSKRPYRMEKALNALGSIGLVFALIVAVSKQTEYGRRAAVAMVGAAVAVVILVNAVKMLGNIEDPDALEQGLESLTLVMLEFAGLMAAIFYMSQFTEKAKTAPILAMIGMLGVIVAGLAVLTTISDWQSLIGAGVSLAAVLAGLGVAFSGMSKIQNGGALKSVLTFIEVIGLLAAASAAIILVGQQPWEQVIAAAGSISLVMIAIAAAAKIAKGASSGAEAMLFMSAPMLAAAAALSMIPNYDWQAIIAGGASMGVAMTGAAAAAKIAKGAYSGAEAMLLMCVPIIATGGALSLIAGYDWDSIVAAGAAIGVAAIAVAAAAKIAKGASSGAEAMLLMCAPIIATGASLSLITGFDWDSILASAGAISAVLLAASAAAQIAKWGLEGANAMLLMSIPILATGATLSLISSYKWDSILASAGAISAVMLVASAAANIAIAALPGANAMLLLSVPILASAAALSLIPNYDWGSILTAAGSISLVLLAASAAANIAITGLVGAASMLLMCVPILATAAALALITGYDWTSMIAAAGSLSTVMLLVAIAVNVANTALIGSAAMVVVSVGVLAIAAAMRVVGELPIANIAAAAVAISAVAAVLVVLGAIAGTCPTVAAGMIAVAAAFVVFGAAAVELGVAAALFATAVDIFVDAMVKLSEIGPQEAENIKNSMAQIGTGIGEGLANVVIGFVSTILEAVSNAITGAISWVKTEGVTKFKEGAKALLEGLGLGFLTRPDSITTAVSSCVDWIAGLFGDLKTKLKKAGQDALAGLQEGIQSFKEGGFSGLGEWAGSKVLSGFNKITGHASPWKTMIAAGKDMVRGLNKGVDKGSIGAVGENAANAYLNGLREVWGWHSPWSSMIAAAGDGIRGLYEGAKAKFQEYKTKFASVGESVKTSLTAPLSNLQKAFSDKFGMGADSSVISTLTELFPGLTSMLDTTGDAMSSLGLDSDELSKALGGVSDSADKAGSSTSKAGTAASEASKNVEQNAKFLKYAAKTVQAYTKQYGAMTDKLGDTSSIVSATEAITLLATKVYESEQAYTQTITTAEQAQTRIDEIKKSFVSLYESIQSGIESALKTNEEFDYKYGTTSKSMLKNIDSQIVGFQDYSKALQEMVERGFDTDAVQEYAKMNNASIGEMSALLMMSRTQIEKWNSDYRALADIKENGASELLSTVANSLVRANTDVEKSSKEAHDSIKKYIEDGTYVLKDAAGEVQTEFKDTGAIIVDMASDAASAYGNLAKDAYTVYDANGDVVQSFVQIGDTATEQSHVVETAYKAMQQSIEDTLESQRKFFEEFDTGEDDEDQKTAEDYLDMMQSQIDGTRKWAEMIENISNTLGDTTGASEFMQYLASLGPESYKIVSAFNDASEEELESAVHRYTEIMSLSETQSKQITATFTENGYNSVKEWSTAITTGATEAQPEIVVTADEAGKNFGVGYVNGMASTLESAKTQATTMGLESLTSLQTALQEHSPSKATEEMGTNLGVGLQNGMQSSTAGCLSKAQELGRTILVRFQMDLDKQNFVTIGKNIGEGLVEGMSDSSIMSKVISTASELAKSAYDAAREALDINSPSRKFRSLGKSAVEGFSQGFERYSKWSTQAAESMSEDALSAVSDVVAAMSIAADDNFDLQPTITPVVDMSNISAAGGLLNGYFGQVPMNVSSYINGSTISDALAAISQNTGSSDVVSAIRELRTDVQYLGQQIGQAKVTLDTGVIAGAVTPGVSARINKSVNSKGSVWR